MEIIFISVVIGVIVLIVGIFITPPLKNLANKLWSRVWKTRRKKQEKINKLNLVWKNDRKILSNVKQPLKKFNEMGHFPDKYTAPKCLELASSIEEEAQKIQGPEFQEIREKLLEYTGRKNKINQNTLLHDLLNLFRKRVEPNKYEPLVLCGEIDKVLKTSSIPPSERAKKEKRFFKK